MYGKQTLSVSSPPSLNRKGGSFEPLETKKPGRECGGYFFCRSFARDSLAASQLIYAREETTSYTNYTSI